MRKCLAILLALGLALACLCASAQGYDAVRVTASPCYVRSGPGLGSRIVGTLSTGSYYNWAGSTEYDSRGIAWYNVYYSGGLGWVSALHGELTSLGDGNAPARSGTGTQVYTDASLNVRTGPGLEYPAIGVLMAGESADYTGFQETDSRGVAWYQIFYSGVTGWVSSAYAVVR